MEYRSPSYDIPARLWKADQPHIAPIETTIGVAARALGLDPDDAAWAIEEEGRADVPGWTITAADETQHPGPYPG